MAGPPYSAWVTPSGPFPVGLKSIATSQWSVSNSCFVSRLNSGGPEPKKSPLYYDAGIERGRARPIVLPIHFVIKNRRGRGQSGRPLRKALHCVPASSA